MGDTDGKSHCLSFNGWLAVQTSPRVNCFASYFSTCLVLNVCKRPSGSSPSPKMLPSGPVSSRTVEKSCELAAQVRIYRRQCAPVFLTQRTSSLESAYQLPDSLDAGSESAGGASIWLWAFLLPASLANSKKSLNSLGADTILHKEWEGIINTSRGSLASGVRWCWGFQQRPHSGSEPWNVAAWIAWHSCLG